MTGGSPCGLVLFACDATRALAMEGPRAIAVPADETLDVSVAGAVTTAVNESTSERGTIPIAVAGDPSRTTGGPADCATSGAAARASAAIAAKENRTCTVIDFLQSSECCITNREGRIGPSAN